MKALKWAVAPFAVVGMLIWDLVFSTEAALLLIITALSLAITSVLCGVFFVVGVGLTYCSPLPVYQIARYLNYANGGAPDKFIGMFGFVDEDFYLSLGAVGAVGVGAGFVVAVLVVFIAKEAPSTWSSLRTRWEL